MGGRFAPVLGIALFVAAVFGVTFISQFNLNNADPVADDVAPAEPPKPLAVLRDELHPEPTSTDPAVRFFDAFHETNDTEHPASFWMLNPNPTPTAVSVLGRSCTSCSSARVGGIEPKAMHDFVTRRNAGLPPLLVPSPLPVPDLGAAIAAAALQPHIRWHEFNFDTKGDSGDVPAADGNSPAWGVLQLRVKLGAVGVKQLSVGIGLKNAAVKEQETRTFQVTMVGVSPINVEPPAGLDFGTMAAGSQPRTMELLYWSSTRTAAELPPPVVGLPPSDPFLAVATAVPLTQEELDKLAAYRASDPKNPPAPIKAGYKLSVTAMRPPAPGVPPTPPDIGPFEREIGLSGPNGSTARVTVKGVVTGVVDVVGGDLKYGRFNGRATQQRTITLASDVAGLELEPAPGESKPPYLKVELSPVRVEEGRRFWTMKVAIPPDTGFGPLPGDAAVVLKGTGGQRIRLPVQGVAGLN